MGLPYNAVAPSSHSNLSFRSFTHLSAMRQSVVQTGTIASCRSSTPLCVPSETFQLSKVDSFVCCLVCYCIIVCHVYSHSIANFHSLQGYFNLIDTTVERLGLDDDSR